MKKRKLSLVVLMIIAVTPLFPSFGAAAYPDKPITLIAGLPPGSATDITARAIAEATKKYLPQPLVVMNRPGGAGAIAATEIIQAKPDGYTLGIVPNITLTFQVHRVPVPFGKPEDYSPIINLASFTTILAVRNNAPWKTIQDFIAYAKANPGKVHIGHPGIGTVAYVNIEQLKRLAQIEVVLTPFAGGGEDVSALLGGHVDAVVEPTAVVSAQMRAGRARCLGVFYEKRDPFLPDKQTFKEAGYEISLKYIFYPIIGPKGLPTQIVSSLHQAFKKGMEEAVFKKAMETSGGIISYEGPNDLRDRLTRDYETDAKIVDMLKLKR